jgi:hypothetical protein
MNSIKRRLRPEQIRELSLVVIIILVILFFGSQIESYYNARLFNRISTSVALIAVVAVGMTLVVLTRNIDLSVGSIVGFTAYFVGTQLARNNEMAPATAVLLAIGVGALMGAVNGVLVSGLPTQWTVFSAFVRPWPPITPNRYGGGASPIGAGTFRVWAPMRSNGPSCAGTTFMLPPASATPFGWASNWPFCWTNNTSPTTNG